MTRETGHADAAADLELRHSLDLAASAEDVLTLLTEAAALARWWQQPFAADLEQGATTEFRLGRECALRVRVDALEPPALVVWRCIGGVREWQGTRLRFELHQLGSLTRLRFRHRGWRFREPGSPLSVSGFSWPRQLDRLRQLAPTSGRDAPAGCLGA